MSKKKAETVVYLGPSIKNVIEHGTILNNGLTGPLEKAIEEKPVLQNLIVPVKYLAEAKVDLRKQGSKMAALYKKAQE